MVTQLAQVQAQRSDVEPPSGIGNAPAVTLLDEQRSAVRGIAIAMLVSLPVWAAAGALFYILL